MENLENLYSYEGVERTQLAMDPESLNAYLEDKLRSAESDAEFIQEYCLTERRPYNICEIGCGNRKLLYRLEQLGLLEQGIGFETAQSRVALAEKFGELLGSRAVRIENKNFLEVKPDRHYDLICLVDIVFQFLGPLYDEEQDQALQWIWDALEPGGSALFELEDYGYLIKKIRASSAKVSRKWEEFPVADPFQYGLYQSALDPDGNSIYEKIFLRRVGGGQERFRNIIRSYTRQEFVKLLEDRGFEACVYGYYNSEAERAAAMEEGSYKESLFRVVARKP